MSDEPETRSKRSKRFAVSPAPLSEEEYSEPLSFPATLGLQPVGAPPPVRRSQLPPQPIVELNARGMPARKRKKNRLFFDDHIINDDKPLRMSLSPKKTPNKGGYYQSASASASTKSPSKLKKKLGSKPSSAQLLMRINVASLTGNASEKKSRQSTEPRTPTKSSGTASQPNTPKSNIRDSQMTTPRSVYDTPTSMSSVASTVDKKLGQSIGLRLRNLLKLPKAHKWVIYEWFYSFIDKGLLEHYNDFELVLSEHLPRLNTRALTRAEWRKVRSLLGKPRRASQHFFDEERRELERKRQKIRFLQTKKSGEIKDSNYVRDLPDKIPMTLPVGTKVTARLRQPQDGIFSGTVDAFDSLTSTYRVTFDRNNLGTHSIPDFEIVSENFHEHISLQSVTRDFRPNLMSTASSLHAGNTPLRSVYGMRSALKVNLNKSDPLLGQEVSESPFRNIVLGHDTINGYPVKLLENLVRLNRAMESKRKKLKRLGDMNNEAQKRVTERMAAEVAKETEGGADQQPTHAPNDNGAAYFTDEFQRRYASVILSLERVNRDIQDYLNEVQAMAADLSRDPQIQAMLTPSYLRELCREEADVIVERNNQGTVKNERILKLIKNLTTLLLVTSHLGNEENTAQVSKVLEGCTEEVRSTLNGSNIDTFKKHVQLHLHHIRLGIGQNMLNNSNNSGIVAANYCEVETHEKMEPLMNKVEV